MRKVIISALVTASLSVNAAGIPVVDVAGLAQMVKDTALRAHEFKQTIGEAKSRLNHMKADLNHYKKMVDGHFDFEKVINDPFLNDFMAMDNWQQIYDSVGDVSSLREEFGLKSDDPAIQSRFDQELKQFKFNQILYQNSVKRNKRIQDLAGKYASATTPAAKSDLANAISYEEMQMKNDQQMMEKMTALMDKQRSLEANKAAEKSIDNIFGTGIPLKSSS